jgi:hypothetical protein
MADNLESKAIDLLTDKEKGGWKKFWNLIFRLIILLVLLLLIINLISYLYPKTSVEKVEALGNTIYFKTHDKDLYYYLFPTSDIWANPGIEFNEGDELTIVASGKYNTAIHHLVDFAKTDTNRLFQWIGPEGLSYDDLPRNADKLRFKGCPEANANYGALLVRQLTSGTNESKIFRYDINEKKIRMKFDAPGSIEFCVNEPLLDTSEASKNLYIITEQEDKAYSEKRSVAEQERAWEKIKKEGSARQLWFDDNVGELFIVVEKKTSR